MKKQAAQISPEEALKGEGKAHEKYLRQECALQAPKKQGS